MRSFQSSLTETSTDVSPEEAQNVCFESIIRMDHEYAGPAEKERDLCNWEYGCVPGAAGGLAFTGRLIESLVFFEGRGGRPLYCMRPLLLTRGEGAFGSDDGDDPPGES